MFSPKMLRVFCTGLFLLSVSNAWSAPESTASTAVTDAERLHRLLEDVYRVMDEQYYLPVSRSAFEDFVRDYPAERVRALNERSRKTDDFVHLGAGLLVDKLKHPTDRFTGFVPPKLTKTFKQKAYAAAEDLGLEGRLVAGKGFEITRVQKHCQAHAQGMRTGDVVLSIAGQDVLTLTEEQIGRLLKPVVGSKVRLTGISSAGRQTFDIELTAESYFRQTVQVIPTDRPGALVLKIDHFNQMTGPDFADELRLAVERRTVHLVIDLRDNEGGPPLAAREILGYFLPTNDPLFAVARKRKQPVLLTAPTQPLRFSGRVSVLINSRTGSAAEVLSGVLQAKGLALLVGTQTAGGAYLKSVYDFEDGSMIFMVTSLTFLFNRQVFPADGLRPDVALPAGVDALQTALADAPFRA